MKNNKLALMTAGVLALAACDSNEMARNIGHGAAEELAQQGKELVGKLGKELIKEHAQRKTQKTEQQTKTSGVVDYPQTDIHPDSSLELDCNHVLYKTSHRRLVGLTRRISFKYVSLKMLLVTLHKRKLAYGLLNI